MPRVFGMVTTRASADYTIPALKSFFEHTAWRDTDAFLLIDNDGGFDRTCLPPACAKIQVVANAQPCSFAVNANQVIQHANQFSADAFVLNNDVIFTADWLGPLAVPHAAVMTPTCNQNYQYQTAGLDLKPVMTLQDYVGREELFRRLVERHQALHTGYMEAYKTNFFCVKVPPVVYRSVGLFDTRFGVAGGEDDDYCIRAYLAGFHVLVAIGSYLLHFGGRSTWSGPETMDQWRAREHHFVGIFQRKWGPTLSRLLLFRDASILANDPSLQEVQKRAGIGGLFAELARRDGISLAAPPSGQL